MPVLGFSGIDFTGCFTFSGSVLVSKLVKGVVNGVRSVLVKGCCSTSSLKFCSRTSEVGAVTSASAAKIVRGMACPALTGICGSKKSLGKTCGGMVVVAVLFINSMVSLLVNVSSSLFKVLVNSR